MDESGDPGQPGSTATYAVAVVMVKDGQWSDTLDNLVKFRRYLKANFGLRLRDEVKGNQLATAAGPWVVLGLGPDIRHRIYRSFMRLQAKMGTVKTFAVVTDKSKVNTTSDVRDTTWRYAFQRMERFGRDSNENVMLIADVGEDDPRRKLWRKMRRFAPVGAFYGGPALQRPIENGIEDPVVRLSHHSYFIQLADLNAYAAFRRVVPTQKFPQMLWDELDTALHLPVNRLRTGRPPAIVLAP
jgi:hypothetical protein